MTRTGTAMPLTAKVAAAAGVVGIAETIFDPDSAIGSVLGLLALAAIVALVSTRPVVLRHGPSRIAALAAAGYAMVLVDDPNPLALLLFAIALSLATLLPHRSFDHALRWVPRLVRHALSAVPRPWRDLAWAGAARRRKHGETAGPRAIAAMLVLPVVGGGLFLTLFASANPLIDRALATMVLPDLGTTIWRVAIGGIVFTAIWATLRPRLPVATPGDALDPVIRIMPGTTTLVLSLATFNAIFAVQNVLDLAFLWSGAGLPAGVTMADYAHRGAYALIVTALLAGVFVLATLRPGSAAAASPAIRRLVTVWIAQNLLLVASSALRLVDYVAAYSLTTLRLAAMAWMALVGIGLALILWRLLRARSAAWLVNANALAAALVLGGASIVDIGASAAAWNVHVALAQGRAGPPLDLCYLARLGPQGLVALARLERHAKDATVRDRIAFLRWQTQAGMLETQRDWRGWTARDARRLGQATAMVGAEPQRLRPAPDGRGCDGRIVPPPATRLTNGAQR